MRRREFITLLSGTAVAWPLAARAQQPAIGFLSTGTPESDVGRLSAVRQGMKETGYVEAQNVAIEYRGARGQYDRLPALAADLIGRRVAVIVTVATPSTLAAKAATTTIPIAFVVGFDPVTDGLVTSLNRPGGNVTGVVVLSTELVAKRLQLLHELVPTAAAIALLVNPTNPITEPETKTVREAARSLGVHLHVLRASNTSDIDTAFGTLVELGAGALVISNETFFNNSIDQIVALAARHAVPAIYGWREFAVAGGLMSYGTSLGDAYRQVGIYVGRILKGAKPADLPVQQVMKVELVINLKTAKTLGITFPLTLLGRANEVIE